MKVLITVKTYPLPSEKYMELVCTAGVCEDGSWVRLYPVDYRYKPYWQWYKKYQWISIDAEKNQDDPRPESYRPVSGAVISPLGVELPTENGMWTQRKKVVLAKGSQSMCHLNQLGRTQQSLGVVRPKRVLGFEIERTERDWKPRWQALFLQERLFGPDMKPLEKIPYKFSYKFTCESPSCQGHKMMIEDWEIGQLYRQMRDRYRDEDVACEKVKQKFLGEICGDDKDTHFFVGTVLEFGTWVVLGTFYPKRVAEDPQLPLL